MGNNTKDRNQLKAYFVKNAIPTESNFADLIEGMLNLKDDAVYRERQGPLCIEAAGDGNASDPQEALSLYKTFGDHEPAWVLSLNPQAEGSGKPGLSIGRTNHPSDFFIQGSNGHVGVGTLDPTNPLTVRGTAKVDSLGIGVDAPTGSIQDDGTATLSGSGLQIDSAGQIAIQGKKPIHYKVYNNHSPGATISTLPTDYLTSDWILMVGGFWMEADGMNAQDFRGSKIWSFEGPDQKWHVSLDLLGLTASDWYLSLAFFNRKLFQSGLTIPSST